MNVMRAAIDALLPPGSAWTPEQGAGLDLLLNGMAANQERARLFLSGLANLRNPALTPILDDLEREFGILPDPSESEATRRTRLKVAKTSSNGDGSQSFMQGRLQAAGFNVQVYNNYPSVDPAPLLSELVVNGPIAYNQNPVDYHVPLEQGYWPLVSFVGGSVVRDDSGVIRVLNAAMIPYARQQEFIRLIVKFKPLHSWIGVKATYY